MPRFRRRTAPGTPPGSLVPDPDAPRPLVRYFQYDDKKIAAEQDCQVNDLPRAAVDETSVLWVDVVGLGDVGLIRALGERFGLHDLALEDVVNVHQRTKVEDYGEYVYIVVRMPIHGAGGDTEQVSIFLSRGLVLTFQERPGDCFEPIRQRIRQGKGRIRAAQADYLVYALLDAVMDSYFPVLDVCGEALASLEDELIADPKPRQIEQVHGLKRELLAIRRAVWPARDLLATLLRGELTLLRPTTEVYLRDVHDHTVQLIDIVETYREIASGLGDAYLSSQSTKLNEVMKVLTIISTVFLPLTFITGLYGMNFDRGSPWNMPELGWRFGYGFALLLMAVAAVGLVYYFWSRGWLRER